MVEVIRRLRERDFRRLRMYQQAKREGAKASWAGWLRTLCIRACIDHVRAHPEFFDERRAGKPGRWVEMVGLSEAPAHSVSPEDLALAGQLLARAREHLRGDQREALHAWLAGLSFAEIAQRLDIEDARGRPTGA